MRNADLICSFSTSDCMALSSTEKPSWFTNSDWASSDSRVRPTMSLQTAVITRVIIKIRSPCLSVGLQTLTPALKTWFWLQGQYPDSGSHRLHTPDYYHYYCIVSSSSCHLAKHGKVIWRKKCERSASATAAAGRWGGGSRRQSWMKTSGLWYTGTDMKASVKSCQCRNFVHKRSPSLPLSLWLIVSYTQLHKLLRTYSSIKSSVETKH